MGRFETGSLVLNSSHRTVLRVAAAILANRGRVLIAQRKAGDRLAGQWEFPGGKIANGESPQQCVVREIEEELGIVVSIGEFLGSHLCREDQVTIDLLVYRAFLQGGEIRVRDHAACLWVPVDHLGRFEFCPADKPFVEDLRRGAIAI
jgi:8-oxo-dGTP diphosphatase